MPIPPGFAEQFETYRAQAQEADRQRQHHDQRRELFLTFITQVFNIDPADIRREEFISLVHRHGWVDALFRDLVFEFKRDLVKEHAEGLRELRDYVSRLSYAAEHVGLLTDGLRFEVYILAEDDLRPTDAIDLATADPETAFVWLDSYLFSQKGILPTSADLVRRFGAKSPTFLGAARVLGGLLKELGSAPGIEVKKRQWRTLLTRVYGSDVTSDDLFVRHTYLAQFAKVLAYAASNGNDTALYDTDTLEGIVNGRAFQMRGFANVGGRDFFTWILEPEACEAALRVLRGLAGSLVIYDLSRIDQDLFKQLYQNLVDPETRHDLGEYYTPDWLAELTLEEMDYRPGKSLLDPACGSGTFLFSAIKRLEAQGTVGWDLINFALDNVVGMDVHPLAANIARINYYLALLPHVDSPGGPMRDGKPYYGLLTLPVHNADALAATESTLKGDALPVAVSESEQFLVPVSAARNPEALGELLDALESYARERPAVGQQLELFSSFDTLLKRLFPPETNSNAGMADLTQSYWRNNLRLLSALIEAGRNGIWRYVLENYSRPLTFALRKFDVVMGNPPWLSYRFIKDKGYQKEVKALSLHYGLLASSEVKLFTQMDLSTLFFTFCEDRYLAKGGTIAFVMPRSVLTGAKQHRAFQARGMARAVDLQGVSPLFNVPACVVIRQAGRAAPKTVHVAHYSGRLPRHEMRLEEALAHLERRKETFSAIEQTAVKSPHYHEQFKAGASLYPRNLVFMQPTRPLTAAGAAAFSTLMKTDPDAERDAKAPWKGIRLTGHVDPLFWFATLLSKHLVPFGVRQFSLVALPLEVRDDGGLAYLDDQAIADRGLKLTLDEWFWPARQQWEALKKETSNFGDLFQRLDYQHTLTGQRTRGVFKVIYNASGTNVSAAVVDTHGSPPEAYRYPTQGLVTEITTYSADFSSGEEAHYLCALLNTPCVNASIKAYQPRGSFGERHIHRRPFEYCAIPVFDSHAADHLALARLGQEAHAAVAGLDLAGMTTARARKAAREAARDPIAAIDAIARRLLGL